MDYNANAHEKWLDQSVPLYDEILYRAKWVFKKNGEADCKIADFKGKLTHLFDLIDPVHVFKLSSFEEQKRSLDDIFRYVKVLLFESDNNNVPNLIRELEHLIKNKLIFYRDLEKEFSRTKAELNKGKTKSKKGSGDESSIG